jgi:hypothetical protein
MGSLGTCSRYLNSLHSYSICFIGDIVGGLQSTVGKQGKVTIPEGWTCCELGEVENGVYSTGTLIAEKPQWVVMKAPADTAKPNITFEWLAGLVTHMISYTTNVVSELDVASQRDRCFVAKVFVEASAAIEQDNRSQARAILRDAKTVLDRSIAKDTTFVVQLYAQIDQMLEEIQHMAPAAILSRMATGTAVLGNQRGILTGGDPRAFSSPLQVNTSSQMTTRYSQEIEEMDSINNVD